MSQNSRGKSILTTTSLTEVSPSYPVQGRARCPGTREGAGGIAVLVPSAPADPSQLGMGTAQKLPGQDNYATTYNWNAFELFNGHILD